MRNDSDKGRAEGGFQPRSPSADERAEALMHDMGVRALAGELSAVKRSDGAVVIKCIADAIRDAERAAREATMDEFGILHGDAATSFLAEMERPRSPAETAKHNAFMDECVAIYKKSQPAECQRCGVRCTVCDPYVGNAPSGAPKAAP